MNTIGKKITYSCLIYLFLVSMCFAAVVNLRDLTVSSDRIPNWNPGVGGGIPDTSEWTLIEANNAPYNIVGDGVTEVGEALQDLLDDVAATGVPTKIHLGPGTYILGYGNHIAPGDNTLIYGDGPDETILVYYPRQGGTHTYRSTFIFGSDYALAGGSSSGATTSLSSNASAGDSTVTVSSTSSFAVDDWIIIAEIGKDTSMFQNVGSTNATAEMISHIAKVTEIDGNDVTFDRSLRIGMRTAYSAQIRKLEMRENAGISDLKLQGNENGETQGAIAFHFAANCWVDNVEITKPVNRFVVFDRAARNTIQSSYFHGPSLTASPANNYGIDVKEGGHDNLITNNRFYQLYTTVLVHEGASGNVISYNYVTASRHPLEGWRTDMECHGEYPHENLFEGNDLPNGGRHDNYWGMNGPRNTWFRNRMSHGSGNNAKTTANGWFYELTTSLPGGEYQINLILNHVNVMTGTVGWNTPPGWPIDALTRSVDDNTYMWIERNVATDDTGVTGIAVNPIASRTMADNYTGSAAPASWDSLDFPASLYLDSRPSFWPGSKAWPGIGGDVDEHESNDNVKLPAQDRFDGVISAPGNFRIIE